MIAVCVCVCVFIAICVLIAVCVCADCCLCVYTFQSFPILVVYCFDIKIHVYICYFWVTSCYT